eukprot:symbB.v1.2.002215.t1/scaffold119.1/size318073/13
MAQKSLYDVLLVDQNATLDEIKLAFKRRALQVHPDKGGSKEEFHLVYQALETLGDPAARQKYDHSLAASKTGPAPHASHPSHAPYPKEKKRKREEKPAHPATSCKAKPEAKQKMPQKKSTTSAGKAPSKPPRATATPAEPQTEQTKLLMKIRDLLKQLPRDARNDVITNQFSQKQRVLLERFMVDNANTSSGTKCHSEAEALAPAPTSKSNATNQAGFEIEAVSKATSQSTADSSHGSNSLALAATSCSVAMAKSTEKKKSKKRLRSTLGAVCNEPHGVAASVTMQASNAHLLASEAAERSARPYPKGMEETKGHAGCYPLKTLALLNSEIADSKCKPHMARAKRPAKVRARKKGINTKTRSCTGGVMRNRGSSSSYFARICFDSFVMRTGRFDLKTALDYLVILTSVKQEMQNQAGRGTFVERLQAALAFCAAEHGRNLADLKLGFQVFQHAGCFIGSPLISPVVRSPEVFGKMRSVLAPFREYAKRIGPKGVYTLCSPVHLEDAWEQFQLAAAEVWKIAGVDSTVFLQKIRSLYEAQAPFRSASLQRWEREHMAKEDKRYKNRQTAIKSLERWERRQMARQDKNKHRPKKLRERNPTGCLQRWERRQMAMQDKNKHRPQKLRERNPTGCLERWERRQMAMQDKNKHRPKKLRERNPTGHLQRWERRQMACEDKNEHRPKRLRQKLQFCESSLSGQLTALRKLIGRWRRMLKREAKVVDKERQKVLRQRKAQQKKDQEERKRAEVLKQKRLRAEERSRREWVRKRMQSDLTMDDILGPKSELLLGLLEPLLSGRLPEHPLWWPIYGPRIEAFRASQRQLVEGNLEQLRALQRRPNTEKRDVASFNPEHQSNLIALRRVARAAARPTLKVED